MSQLVDQRGFPLNGDVNNGAPAASEIPMRLAGTLTYLDQWINGRRQNGATKVAPNTGQNRSTPGHDHTGGMMGVPMKHTIWSACYGSFTGATTNSAAPKQDVDSVNTPRNIPANGFTTVRGVFIPHGKCYQLLKPSFYIYVETNPCDVDFSVAGRNGVVTRSESFGSTGIKTVVFDDDERITLWPGHLNTYGFQLKITETSGAAVVWLLAAGLHQTSTSV